MSFPLHIRVIKTRFIAEAVCPDAEGAFFNLLQLRKHKGAALVNEVGPWTWNQLNTRDLDKANSFLRGRIRMVLRQGPRRSPGHSYSMRHLDGQRWEEGLAGIMEIGDMFPAEAPPHWMIYFAVADAQVACDKTAAAGGQVTVPPARIPIGTLAVVVNPQGAKLGIIQPDIPKPVKEHPFLTAAPPEHEKAPFAGGLLCA